ncbi:MAG: DUF3040 domain-containing protein [Corynebacterium sp.]|nr:DUF3040 domain-containing protein [Corynebacterium sp.]
MALSEQEQNALREIERSLMADDPHFGASMTGKNARFDVRAAGLVIVGLVVLVLGVVLSQMSWWFLILSIVGFVAMFGSCIWMLRASRNDAPGARRPANSGRGRNGRGPGHGSIEDRFYRRFQ